MASMTTGLAGLILLITGMIRIWIHTGSVQFMILPGCGDMSFAIPVSSSLAHCWGCYAAASGLLLMAGALILRFRPALAQLRAKV